MRCSAVCWGWHERRLVFCGRSSRQPQDVERHPLPRAPSPAAPLLFRVLGVGGRVRGRQGRVWLSFYQVSCPFRPPPPTVTIAEYLRAQAEPPPLGCSGFRSRASTATRLGAFCFQKDWTASGNSSHSCSNSVHHLVLLISRSTACVGYIQQPEGIGQSPGPGKG